MLKKYTYPILKLMRADDFIFNNIIDDNELSFTVDRICDEELFIEMDIDNFCKLDALVVNGKYIRPYFKRIELIQENKQLEFNGLFLSRKQLLNGSNISLKYEKILSIGKIILLDNVGYYTDIFNDYEIFEKTIEIDLMDEEEHLNYFMNKDKIIRHDHNKIIDLDYIT